MGLWEAKRGRRYRLPGMHFHSSLYFWIFCYCKDNKKYDIFQSLQFDAVENGIAITKLMQIFSRQAPMMDALLSYFAEQMKRRREGYDGQPPEINGPEGKQCIRSSLTLHSWNTISI